MLLRLCVCVCCIRSTPKANTIARDDYLFSFRFLFPLAQNIPLSIHEENAKGENGQKCYDLFTNPFV